MSQPPRAMESILKGLGADPYLSDVILGDLAEEYDQRAAFDGEAEARRWYTTEALRSVPHLLRSAFGRLRVGDVPRLIGNALFAWLSLLPVGLTVYVVVASVLRLAGIDWFQFPNTSPGFIALAMLAMPVSGLVGGYVAAWRNAHAPMIGAVAFGIVLTSINLIAGLFAPSPLTPAYRIAALAMFNAGAIIGGAIRVIRLKPSTGSALSTS